MFDALSLPSGVLHTRLRESLCVRRGGSLLRAAGSPSTPRRQTQKRLMCDSRVMAHGRRLLAVGSGRRTSGGNHACDLVLVAPAGAHASTVAWNLVRRIGLIGAGGSRGSWGTDVWKPEVVIQVKNLDLKSPFGAMTSSQVCRLDSFQT